MSSDLLRPRGDALTEVMDLTARDGVRWVAYIDGFPPVPARRLLPQTVLPGRRLRFDSATESRISPSLPAGSPFLGERRLLALLSASPLLTKTEQGPPPPAPGWRERWQVSIASVCALCVRRGRALADATHLVLETLVEGHRARW